MMAVAREIKLPVKLELESAVVVRPGDKLVVGLSGVLNMAQAADIKQRLADKLPGVEFVLIDTCTSLAVYRSEQPDDAAIMRWIQANPSEFETWLQVNDAIRRHQDRAP